MIMEKAYDYAKSKTVNFKLDSCCCCLATIRIGLFIIGYFNVFIAVLSIIMGTSDEGITPPLMEVQNIFLEDDPSKPVAIIAYACELAFNIVLLCGVYREDIILLRAFVYFQTAGIVSAILIYSMVIAAMSLLTKMVIIANMVYNGYVILLARSAIVEIEESRTSEKNGHVALYSVVKVAPEEGKIDDIQDSIEAAEVKVEKVEIIKTEENTDGSAQSQHKTDSERTKEE